MLIEQIQFVGEAPTVPVVRLLTFKALKADKLQSLMLYTEAPQTEDLSTKVQLNGADITGATMGIVAGDQVKLVTGLDIDLVEGDEVTLYYISGAPELPLFWGLGFPNPGELPEGDINPETNTLESIQDLPIEFTLITYFGDTFDGSELDPDKWESATPDVFTVSGGKVIQAAGNAFARFNNVDLLDLRGKRYAVKADPTKSFWVEWNGATGGRVTARVQNASSGWIISWNNDSGSGDNNTSCTFPTEINRAWVAIRNSGTTYYLEYSPDGETWTVAGSMTASFFDASAVLINLFGTGSDEFQTDEVKTDVVISDTIPDGSLMEFEGSTIKNAPPEKVKGIVFNGTDLTLTGFISSFQGIAASLTPVNRTAKYVIFLNIDGEGNSGYEVMTFADLKADLAAI